MDRKSLNNYNEKTKYFHDLSREWDETVGNNRTRLDDLRRILQAFELKKGDRVLDLGCGNGILLPLIEDIIGPEGEIYAIDAAAGMIDRAREKFAHYGNIIYVNELLEKARLPKRYFTHAMAFAVFPHFEDKEEALKIIHRLLAEKGNLYIFHLADTVSLNDFHSRLEGPVSRDVLPGRDEFIQLFRKTSFVMQQYIDKEDFNLVRAVKCGS